MPDRLGEPQHLLRNGLVSRHAREGFERSNGDLHPAPREPFEVQRARVEMETTFLQKGSQQPSSGLVIVIFELVRPEYALGRWDAVEEQLPIFIRDPLVRVGLETWLQRAGRIGRPVFAVFDDKIVEVGEDLIEFRTRGDPSLGDLGLLVVHRILERRAGRPRAAPDRMRRVTGACSRLCCDGA